MGEEAITDEIHRQIRGKQIAQDMTSTSTKSEADAEDGKAQERNGGIIIENVSAQENAHKRITRTASRASLNQN